MRSGWRAGSLAVCFSHLAAYVTVAAAWSLWTRTGEAFLARPRRDLGRHSVHALPCSREDCGRRKARESRVASGCDGAVTCGWQSMVVVVSLGAQWAVGA